MRRPLKEEALNAATHAAGFLLAVAATLWTAGQMAESETIPTKVWVGFGIYAVTLMGLYLTSTLSHVFRKAPWHSRFRRLDQAFIYLLILGTYTPLATVFVQQTASWTIFGIAWAFAIYGGISKIWLNHRVENVSVTLYLMLGWGPALVVFPIGDPRVLPVFQAMVGGGIAYCLGIYFLFHDNRVWYFHGIWHLFVMIGSAIHFASITDLLLTHASAGV